MHIAWRSPARSPGQRGIDNYHLLDCQVFLERDVSVLHRTIFIVYTSDMIGLVHKKVNCAKKTQYSLILDEALHCLQIRTIFFIRKLKSTLQRHRLTFARLPR
jgi:hypothetical protein